MALTKDRHPYLKNHSQNRQNREPTLQAHDGDLHPPVRSRHANGYLRPANVQPRFTQAALDLHHHHDPRMHLGRVDPAANRAEGRALRAHQSVELALAGDRTDRRLRLRPDRTHRSLPVDSDTGIAPQG